MHVFLLLYSSLLEENVCVCALERSKVQAVDNRCFKCFCCSMRFSYTKSYLTQLFYVEDLPVECGFLVQSSSTLPWALHFRAWAGQRLDCSRYCVEIHAADYRHMVDYQAHSGSYSQWAFWAAPSNAIWRRARRGSDVTSATLATWRRFLVGRLFLKIKLVLVKEKTNLM